MTVLTLALALGDDLIVGNLAMPRMTIIWMMGFTLGTVAAHACPRPPHG